MERVRKWFSGGEPQPDFNAVKGQPGSPSAWDVTYEALRQSPDCVPAYKVLATWIKDEAPKNEISPYKLSLIICHNMGMDGARNVTDTTMRILCGLAVGATFPGSKDIPLGELGKFLDASDHMRPFNNRQMVPVNDGSVEDQEASIEMELAEVRREAKAEAEARAVHSVKEAAQQWIHVMQRELEHEKNRQKKLTAEHVAEEIKGTTFETVRPDSPQPTTSTAQPEKKKGKETEGRKKQ